MFHLMNIWGVWSLHRKDQCNEEVCLWSFSRYSVFQHEKFVGRRVTPPVPYRIAKALDPVIYRNTELDIWEEDQRGMNETELSSFIPSAWKLERVDCITSDAKKNIQRNLPTWLKVIFKIELRYDWTSTFLFYFCQWEEILSKVSLKI